MLNCRLKVISPYNHGSSKCERQIQMISEIIMKHLWDKGQMWPLFAMTAAYAMNTFASEVLSGLSPFQLVFLRDPCDLTGLSFPKIDTIPVKHSEYYNLLLARAQLVGNMLLEWRTKQALECHDLKGDLMGTKFLLYLSNMLSTIGVKELRFYT